MDFLERLLVSCNNGEDLRDINKLQKDNLTLYGYRCCGSDGALAFTINKRKKIIDKIISHISLNDYICFMFGEVDCRFKLYTYSIKENIDIKIKVEVRITQRLNFLIVKLSIYFLCAKINIKRIINYNMYIEFNLKILLILLLYKYIK